MFNGRVSAFNVTIKKLFNEVGGFNCSIKKSLIKRFELTFLNYFYKNTLSFYDKDKLRALNTLFSQMSSINNQVLEVNRINLIKIYLIKTYKGRAQALGKPSRGQRT